MLRQSVGVSAWNVSGVHPADTRHINSIRDLMKLVWGREVPPRSSAWLKAQASDRDKLALVVVGDEPSRWKRIARRDRIVVGVLPGRRERDASGPVGRIDDLLVHPAFQRRGLGTSLVCAAIRAWSQSGVLRYSTDAATDESRRLFARIGFTQQGEDFFFTLTQRGTMPSPCG